MTTTSDWMFFQEDDVSLEVEVVVHATDQLMHLINLYGTKLVGHVAEGDALKKIINRPYPPVPVRPIKNLDFRPQFENPRITSGSMSGATLTQNITSTTLGNANIIITPPDWNRS